MKRSALTRRAARAAAVVAVAASLLSVTACGGDGGGLPGMASGGGSGGAATGGGSGGASGGGSGGEQDSTGGGGGDGGFRVTSVLLTVVPGTLAGVKCKTAVPQTYTAMFAFPKGHKGGEITFRYGATSGSMKEEKMRIPAGQTSATKSFFYSEFLMGGSLAAAQVNVTSPNQVGSATVRPTGMCSEGGLYGGTYGSTTGTTSGSW